MNRRKFLKILSAGLLTAAGGQVAYSSIVEPYNYQIVEQQIPLRWLGAGLHGLRAVQISDLHINSWFTRDHLDRVVDLVLAQKADLVFITGDYLTRGQDRERSLEELYDPLRKLASSLPVFSVLGNHDFYNRAELPIRSLLSETGVMDVTNAMKTYERNGDTLVVAGIGTYTTKNMRLYQVDAEVPKNFPTVLLAHEPDVAKYTSKTGKFGLQLSGHSHGGQINLPLLGPITLPEMGMMYPAGLYTLGDLLLYTNRGIGMTHIPIRMNCPPEITVFTFTSPL
jgi:uncharacterized protein